MPLGVSSGISWGRPEGLLGRLGSVSAVPEASWGVLGAPGSLSGSCGGHVRAILGPSWRLSGPPWHFLGPFWRRSIKEESGVNLACPSRSSEIASWAHLEALLERSWALLG
eukprot:7755527-Pyramimonas_sp.AAC.1